MRVPGRILALIAGPAVIGVLLGSATAGLGEHKDVAGTKHDVATPGTPACVYCHVPRDAAGQLLWPGGQPDGGVLAGEKRLCFSCHDGTVSRDRSYVFDPERPEHKRNPGVEGQDCDRCHDAHGAGYDKFLRIPGGANFCWNCHFRAGPSDHPIGVDARAAASIHPVDTSFDPKAGDFSGTRLWNASGTGPGNDVMCLTCHSPHGGQPNSEMNTVAFTPSQGAFQALCDSCHVGRGKSN